MRQLSTVVTRKGQVTIPAEIRRSLGLRRGDKVAFVMEKDRVELARAGSVVASTRGVFQSEAKALTAEELRRVGEEAIAAETVERSGS